MGLSEAVSLVFAFLLMVALAVGAILRAQVLGPDNETGPAGPVASASMADPTHGAPPLVAYAHGQAVRELAERAGLSRSQVHRIIASASKESHSP